MAETHKDDMDLEKVSEAFDEGCKNRDDRAIKALSLVFKSDMAEVLDENCGGLEGFVEILRTDKLDCPVSVAPMAQIRHWFEQRGGDEFKEKALYNAGSAVDVSIRCNLLARTIALYLRSMSRIEDMLQDRGEPVTEMEQAILDEFHRFTSTIIVNEDTTVDFVTDIYQENMRNALERALLAAMSTNMPQN